MFHRLIFPLSLISVGSILATTDAAASKGIAEELDELVAWVRSKGGYFRPKQETKYEGNLFGIFATEDIEEGELLASIPWDCVITTTDKTDKTILDEPASYCHIAKALAEELKQGPKSSFSLYTDSLLRAAKDHAKLLPKNWSKEGKALLLNVINQGLLPPEDPFSESVSWISKCEKPSTDMTDDLFQSAIQLVTTHSEDFGFVPVVDKYNHHSRANAYFAHQFSPSSVAMEVYSHRFIPAGEQIFVNYKVDTHPLEEVKRGTPELLRDYGFLEPYPQRWFFKHDGGDVAFDIVEVPVDEDENTVEFFVKWLDKGATKPDIEFLRKQLTRLQDEVYPKLSKTTDVSKAELDMISKFCNYLMTAMTHAIQDFEAKGEGDRLDPARKRSRKRDLKRSQNGRSNRGRRRRRRREERDEEDGDEL